MSIEQFEAVSFPQIDTYPPVFQVESALIGIDFNTLADQAASNALHYMGKFLRYARYRDIQRYHEDRANSSSSIAVIYVSHELHSNMIFMHESPSWSRMGWVV